MIEMLARMPDLRRRIQAEHIAEAGGRCRDCRGAVWPCELYRMATEADRRRGPGTGGRFGPGRTGPAAAWASGSDPRALDGGPRPAEFDARAAEREAWIAERGGPAPLWRGPAPLRSVPRQANPGVVPVPAAPVWMSGPPARLAPVPSDPASRWAGNAGPAGVGARLGGPGGWPGGSSGHTLPGTDLPAPRTTIGAFPVVPPAGGAHPAPPAPAHPGSPSAPYPGPPFDAHPRYAHPGYDRPTELSLRHDELRARREAHLARRDALRSHRENGDRRRGGGRHNLGWPCEEPSSGAGHGRLPRPRGEPIDVLAEVLRY